MKDLYGLRSSPFCFLLLKSTALFVGMWNALYATQKQHTQIPHSVHAAETHTHIHTITHLTPALCLWLAGHFAALLYVRRTPFLARALTNTRTLKNPLPIMPAAIIIN